MWQLLHSLVVVHEGKGMRVQLHVRVLHLCCGSRGGGVLLCEVRVVVECGGCVRGGIAMLVNEDVEQSGKVLS